MRAWIIVGLAGCSTPPPTADQLGSYVFFDQNLSEPVGQACADCHAPAVYFRDPEGDRSTSAGAIAGRFGPRNAPAAMYARYIPPLHLDAATHEWVGGLFWDGRAGSLEEQAAGPLLNPLEMNNADKAAVVAKVRASSYAHGFRDVYGPSALDDVDTAFGHITEAIATYERTAVFAPFSSKYDRYLEGRIALTAQEQRGLQVFDDPKRGNCASCHPSRPGADGTPPLFTTFGYANLGVPRYGNSKFFVQAPEHNPDGAAYVDHGLADTVGDPAQDGKFRIPTLRNVMRTAPFAHNGYFANVPYMVDFLNTRDGWSQDGAWFGPEVPVTVDQRVGHLGLSRADVDDLVAFLATLTDAR